MAAASVVASSSRARVRVGRLEVELGPDRLELPPGRLDGRRLGQGQAGPAVDGGADARARAALADQVVSAGLDGPRGEAELGAQPRQPLLAGPEPLRAERQAPLALVPGVQHPPADAPLRLEHDDVVAGAREARGRHEAGQPGAHDRDLAAERLAGPNPVDTPDRLLHGRTSLGCATSLATLRFSSVSGTRSGLRRRARAPLEPATQVGEERDLVGNDAP